MANSYSSSGTSSVSFSRSRKGPEVTLDDVATVVAGLNSKVLQLRREILALRDSAGSERTDGRAGYGDSDDRKSKKGVPRLHERKDDGKAARTRKPDSNFVKKKLQTQQNEDSHREKEERSSSTPLLSDSIPTNQRKSKQRIRKNSLDRGKGRKSLTSPVKPEEFNVSDKITKEASTNESSRGILRNSSKDETTQTLVKPKQKKKIFGQVFAKKLGLESSKNRATSSRNRKYSYENHDGVSGAAEFSSNSESFENQDRERKSMTKHDERNRNALPSGVTTECQGIRHALGLSTAYCNCYSTGSAVRRVRRKRISRGVQCDQLNDNKDKRSGGLGGCFTFKCCVAKRKKTERKKWRNSKESSKSSESLDAYRPKNDKYEKDGRLSRKNVTERNREVASATRNHRIRGGAEQIISQRLQHGEASLPGFFENVNNPQRHPRGTRRKTRRAVEDRWIQKNDVKDVKRRLNECLIELNGIIGDVGFIFKENNEQR